MTSLSGSTILITGGTGSFGNAMAKRLLSMRDGPASVRILSRDEVKQAEMRALFADHHALRFLLGDVRDRARMRVALWGADYVVHAAALKRVDACEHDPFEAVSTNILGVQNVITAAMEGGCLRVVGLSSDKAVAPLNLYGKTKAVAEDLFRAANAYVGTRRVSFTALRYGNVAGSRGSVIPAWRAALSHGEPLTVHDLKATRFWFTLDGAVDLALKALTDEPGIQLYVPKLASFHVVDLAEAMTKGTGVAVLPGQNRNGDKRHESMISSDEAPQFRDMGPFYSRGSHGEVLPAGFTYRSDTNDRWLGVEELQEALRKIA